MAKLTEEKTIDTFDAVLIIISITAYLLDTVTGMIYRKLMEISVETRARTKYFI